MRNRIEQFLESLRARNLSANTVRAYSADLEQFLGFVGSETNPSDLTRKQIKEYVVLLNGRGITRSSAMRKLASIKSLFHWLAVEGFIPDDIAASVEAPRVPKKLAHYPSEDEMAKLLDSQFMGAFPERDRLIMELLYGTGVRVEELRGMTIDDFREKDVILVRGKGKKERFVLFGECAQDAFSAYLPIREKLLARKARETRSLFFGLQGSEREGLTVRNISRIVKSVARAQGLPERHPHAFRHAFATHMIDRGASIVIVSRLLGHTNLSTTERYTHISSGRMLHAYNAAHPHGSRTPQAPPERSTFNLYATANEAITPKEKEKENAN
jgi:integrase/recombinase XerC